MHDQNGVFTGYRGIGRDITAQIEAEQDLRRAKEHAEHAEAHLERAQEIAKIGSWELNVATGEISWSKPLYHMRGLPLDFKPTLTTLGSIMHPDDVQPRLDWFADLSAGRQREPIEIRIRRPGGEERVNLLEGRPIVDPDGVVRHVAGTAQDITERRLTERKLAQSVKMDAIGQLTGGMAHDFNNMLGVIIGNLDLAKPLLGANALADELCSEARDGAVRCADLIRRLLAIARRQSLRPDQIDLNALVNDVSRLLGRMLGERITLTLDLDAALWPAMVDVSQLESALVNLATNARDAMSKGGQLSITTHNTTLDAGYASQHVDVTAGDYALIEVSDSGTGIPPEIIGRIFEPFFTTKPLGRGTGLGLSMTFGFVKQSGGHMSVYSEPGVGTTFRIYFPRIEGGQATTVNGPISEVVVGGNETILVVEDNAQLRRTAERQLTELGYTVREADGAAPALAMLSDGEKVDLLFTDIVMPGRMDGLDLTYAARRLRSGLRVLLTSGFPGGQSADQRMADSPFRMLGKPYSLMELAQAVRMVLDNGDNGTGPAGGPAPSPRPAGC
jgi:signal transduction histidine kinase/CheY-like chemotaxis protein